MKVTFEIEVDDAKAAAMHASLYEPDEEVEGDGPSLIADLAATCPTEFFEEWGVSNVIVARRLLIDGREVPLRIIR
jgi:hypothetical protein